MGIFLDVEGDGTVIRPSGQLPPPFMASGTGATARTVQNKLRDVVSVKDFGAVGDGSVANEAPAIQAALNAVSAGGTLLIPPGTYNLTSQLTLSTARVRIVAYGAKIVQNGALSRGITMSGAGDIIEGGWWFNSNGNTEYADAPAGSTNAIGIYLDGCDGGQVRNARVEQFGYAQIRIHSSKSVVIDGNELIGVGATLPLVAGQNNNMGVEGYLSGALSAGLRVTNNHIHDLAQGVLTSFDWRDVVISHNVIGPIQGQHGMYLDNAVNMVVQGNTVDTVGQNGIKVQISSNATVDCENVSITGNTINAPSQGGILIIPATTGLTPRFRNISVTANTVRNPGAMGIEVDHAENWSVADNTVSGASTFGIMTGTESKSGRIFGNQIQSTQQTGIYANATSTSFISFIEGNTIDSPGLSATGTAVLRAAIYMGTGRWIVGDNILLNTSSCSTHINSAAAAISTLRRNIDPGTKNNATAGTVSAEGLITNTTASNGQTITPNLNTTGHLFETVPFATWTVAAPNNLDSLATLTVTVSNTSGGAITTTWNAAYHLAGGAWTDPATGFNRSITFRRNNTTWYEVSRTSADTAN